MSEIEFRARPGSRLSDENAQVYGQRIYELMKELEKDEITANDVLDDARKKRSVLHDVFEWDDSVASEEYRLQQARSLLRSIVKVRIVSEEEEPVVLRAFHCVEVGDNGGSHTAYVPEEIVFETMDLSEQVVANALREAQSWRERYKAYSELSKISKAIEETVRVQEKKLLKVRA